MNSASAEDAAGDKRFFSYASGAGEGAAIRAAVGTRASIQNYGAGSFDFVPTKIIATVLRARMTARILMRDG